jgi:ABC-type nickel/cobalt efflux system permease component RcnA
MDCVTARSVRIICQSIIPSFIIIPTTTSSSTSSSSFQQQQQHHHQHHHHHQHLQQDACLTLQEISMSQKGSSKGIFLLTVFRP